MTDSYRAEQVRAAVLEFLAARQTLCYDDESLHRQLNKSRLLDFEATPDDVKGALVFLEGKTLEGVALVAHLTHGLGSTRFYQATSAGVLAHERGTLEGK